MRILRAFYDLECNPITYDCITFLVKAELARKAAGCQSIEFIIVPGTHEGFRNRSPRDKQMAVDDKQYRVHNLILGCAKLLPSITAYNVLASREGVSALVDSADEVYPEGYLEQIPRAGFEVKGVLEATENVQAFRTPQYALNVVTKWFDSPKIVTITLRDSWFQPKRNSNLKEWLRVANYLLEKGYSPIFIPDTEAILQARIPEVEGFPLFPLASLDVTVRSAAYEKAALNLFVSNGPPWVAMFNPNSRMLLFKVLAEGYSTTSPDYFVKHGYVPNETPSFCRPYQKWIWKDDNFETVISAIEGVSS